MRSRGTNKGVRSPPFSFSYVVSGHGGTAVADGGFGAVTARYCSVISVSSPARLCDPPTGSFAELTRWFKKMIALEESV